MDLLGQITNKLWTAKVLTETGIISPIRPDKVLRIGLALQRWGPTPAAGYVGAAIRFPDETAIVDELGTLTFSEVHRRTNALAHALSDAGVKEGDGVAIMCRNHRGFIDATVACSKLGANALFLNTAFAGPQITDVVDREKPVALIYDSEFEALTHDAGKRRKRFIAWHDVDGEGAKPKDPLLEDLIAAGDPSDPVPPEEKGRVVILTSGTTGTPKGANRSQPDSLDPAAALFSKIPFRTRQTTMIAAPMFHSWGFAHFTLAMGLASTLVLRRKFDPETTLQAVAEHEASVLAVVPVMLQRILELPDEVIARYDTSSLRIIAASGSALPGELALNVMDHFGDVLYNLYGSTEVAWATIATARGHARRARHRGAPAARHDRQDLRRAGPRGGAVRDRPDLRRQRDALRGLHRRRRQGRHRRPDGDRRRRPLRLRRPAVRRRPRRRDDRLRRRERLPARGRGPAPRPRRRRGGGGHRGRPTRSSASA